MVAGKGLLMDGKELYEFAWPAGLHEQETRVLAEARREAVSGYGLARGQARAISATLLHLAALVRRAQDQYGMPPDDARPPHDMAVEMRDEDARLAAIVAGIAAR